jgi:soluble lytic murein transglycosylase
MRVTTKTGGSRQISIWGAPSAAGPGCARARRRRHRRRRRRAADDRACRAGRGQRRKPGRHRARRARGAAQARPQPPRRPARAGQRRGNPLALWVEYWELLNRLGEAQQSELTAFAERWSGSYVEDRLRNDWLLELGRRRDWANFGAEFPRFKMNDDRQVTCYSLVTEQIGGRDIKAAGIAAWMAQKEEDDGCALLAAVLVDTKQMAAADIWKKIRLSAEAGKPRAARQAAVLLGPAVAQSVTEIFEGPARYLAKKAGSVSARVDAELAALALTRLATTDAESVSGMLVDRWEKALPADLAAFVWASVARQTATRLQPEAADQFLRAERASKKGKELELPDDLLAWKVRAALRADGGKARWQQVMQAIDAMSPAEQKDPAWIYWKARAMQALPRIRRTARRSVPAAARCFPASPRTSASTASSPPRTSASRRRCRPSRRR